MGGSDDEREEEEAATDLLRDKFRLSTISIAEAEAKRNNMEISEPIVACISDLAFKYAEIINAKHAAGPARALHTLWNSIPTFSNIEAVEQLAKDLELFAQHASRKSVNMEDVILSAHRNEHLAVSLRCFCNELKAKEPQSEKKRKKGPRKDGKAAAHSVLHIPDT